MNCLQLITRSLRMLRVTGGVREIPANMSATALEALQSLVLSLPGATHWTDVKIEAAYTAGENERIWVPEGGSAATITLPTEVPSSRKVLFCCEQYSVVCEGYEDRAPKDGARVQLSGGGTYMYRADSREWMLVTGLTLTTDIPVNEDLQDGLAAMLAVRLADEFGRDLRPLTAAMALDGRQRMRARYGKRQGVAADLVLLRTSSAVSRTDLPN